MLVLVCKLGFRAKMSTILIADDHIEEVAKLMQSLQEQRYIVEYVPDCKRALKRIELGGLSAVVLDWDMTPLDQERDDEYLFGTDVAKRARKLHPDLPIVLRSRNITDWKYELEEHNVHCHAKDWGDSRLIEYLRREIRQK